ncbi:MAG: hypothetical protein KatS3mg062_0891 [Tepidiforma sp.]|nr:MAG: hypothetical protein KatS3mg062_0891 [Tepidiforma sp.]
MRYQRLLVRNFRGVREAEVTFPDGRLLVIEGPNEAGKSSLVEAIWLLFDYPAESNAEEVRSVRPAGLDADPEVELEFSLGAVRCRYRKVFGRRGVTELETVGEVTRRLTGREAHDAAKQLLRERVDEALLRALRVLQGQSLLPPSGLDGSPGLQRALDAGAADTVGEGIFERVREACRQYWTDKRWAATGDLRQAMLDRDQARELVEKLEQRVARLAALEQRVAELEPERDGLREEEAQLKARLAELAEQRAAFEEARREAELAEQAAETAGERRRRLESEVQQREAARREAAALEREVRELAGGAGSAAGGSNRGPAAG